MSRTPALLRALFAERVDERRQQREALHAYHDALRRELDRSRRYERRFAVLAATLIGELREEDRTRLSRAVESSLRTSDVFCIAERRIYLMLPEADANAAQQAFERISELEPSAVDELSLAIAVFPDDGVTMGALLALLRNADVARRRRMSQIDRPLDAAPPNAAAGYGERTG